jgi:hypothetical protein
MTRRCAHTVIAALVVLLAEMSVPEAGEQWLFLPNFQCDIRGVEAMPANADGFREKCATVW